MKKRILIFLPIIFLILVLPLHVYAQKNIILETDKKDLEIGDEVTITVKLPTDIKLYTLTTTLNYDENVFDKINNNNFVPVDGDILSVLYNSQNNKFGLINKTGELKDEIFQIRLKVKDNASVGYTNITLNNITSSDGDNKTNFDKTTISVLITRDAKDGEVVPNIKEDIEVTDEEESIIKVFTTKPIIIGLIVICVLLLIRAIYLYFKKENAKSSIIKLLIGSVILIVLIIVLTIANYRKKDVNGDGIRDYNDAEEILKYLIDLKGTKNNEQNDDDENKNHDNKNDYDVNNDGKVDINDVADSTEQTTQNINYTVKLTEKNEQIYIERGKITLEFNAEVTHNEKMKEIKIDGKYYPVNYMNSSYFVTIDTPDEAGVHEFKITEVRLVNGRTIDIKKTLTKEILKKAPYVDLFNINDENNTFNFKLEDPDKAFKSGKVIVTNKAGDEVINQDIILGDNHINYEFNKDEEYSIIVIGSYDLDSNELNDLTGNLNAVNDYMLFTHQFSILNNYDFKVSDLNITDAIIKNEHPVITFTSTNRNNILIEYVVIDGIQYNVATISKNKYEVVLENYDTSNFGKHHINIDQIVLKNLKSFTNKQDYEINELSFNVLKYAPTIDSINLAENKENSQIKVSYNLNDLDTTLTKLTAVLTDSTNKVLSTKKIQTNEFEKNLSLDYGNNKDGRYTVKFLADYNLGTDRHNYTDKNIGDQEILTQKDIYIDSATVTTYFPKKGQKQFKIKFNLVISDALKEDWKEFAGVTINGLNYDGASDGLKTNEVSFTIPAESGILTLNVDRIKLRNENYNGMTQSFFSINPFTVTLDVLKDNPTIENLEIIDEDYENKSVTFKFTVVDDKGGFNKGQIELNDEKQSIVKGENKITFNNVTQDTLFSLNFYGNYELDTNTIDKDDNKNTFQDSLFYQVSYGLFPKDKFSNLALTNLEVISDNNDSYFEKNEPIKIKFNITGMPSDVDLNIAKIVIKDQIYEVINDNNQYYILLDGYNTAGIKDWQINEVILNNGKKLTLKEPVNFQAEILKDEVTVDTFQYEINNENVNLTLKLKDYDKAIFADENIVVVVYDEDNSAILNIPYKENMSFKIRDNILRYYVKVFVTYDRDIERYKNNYYLNKQLVDKAISLDQNYVEIKSIKDITLYKESNNQTEEIERVNVSDLMANMDSYFIKFTTDEMPYVYSKIKSVMDENNHLILILDYEYTVRENETKKQNLKIDFGPIIDGYVKNSARPESLLDLIEKIKKDPTGSYTLENDIDASNINVDTIAYIDETFTGTLNGNGYTIKNLSKPLFNNIKGGIVENIYFTNVNLPASTSKGTVANTAEEATFKNIIVNGFTKVSSATETGSLIGKASDGTIIENCGVKNINLSVAWNVQQVGGFVGVLLNSTIKNSYVTGNISANWNYVGGMVGNASGSKIISSMAKVDKTGGSNGNVSCSFACATGSVSLQDNVCLSTGSYSNRIFANNIKDSENNYQLHDYDGPSGKTGIKNIIKSDVTKELFEKANFEENIWNLKNVSYENPPLLKIEKTTKIDPNEVGDIYDENKEILYNNLMKLMPFYNNVKIAQSAQNIDVNSIFNKVLIKHIIPVGEDGNIITYLTKDNPDRIKKLKIVFNDNQEKEYLVRYDNTYDMVASYRITELKIDYTYNHYLIDTNSQLINNLTNYLANLNYDDNLDKLTPSSDSRIYKDFYNETTKKELKDFVLKYVSNSNYTNTTNSETISDYIEKEIKKDEKLEKMLYVYNYFRRFYDVDVDGIKLYDLILFDSEGYNKDLTPDGITNIFLANEKNFQTNRTSDAYYDTLSKYTGYQTIPDYLEYLVKTLSKEDPAKWYANQFKGYLMEVNVPGHDEIQYTLWDHLKIGDTNTNAKWYNYALPIITLPENAAYIISTPTQFIIGAQRTYITDPFNASDQALLDRRIRSYAERMRTYYTTAVNIIDDENIFNDIHTVQIDKRYAYDQNGVLTFQNPYSTEEPFHKNFNEVIGQWAYNDYNAATANGAYIIWRVEGLMDGNLLPEDGKTYEYTYQTWAHETAHNMDSRIFLRNYGRRFDAGGEDYADGNLTQSFNDGDIVMNLSMDFAPNSYISVNLTPSRIDSQDKIHDFYKKLFQSVYIMDYLEGKALLTLSSEEQANLVVQASYPNENLYPIGEDKPYYKNYLATVYQTIDKEKIDDMNLNSINDLTKNQLLMYPSVIYSTIIDNRYGGENIYKVRWYQPHNDYGRPDSYSIKWFAYEMLGYAGYDEGYIEYYSNKNSTPKQFAIVDSKGEYSLDDNGNKKYQNVNYKTDLMALRKITNNESITFETYKNNRFAEVEENLNHIAYIDVNAYYNDFITALKKDALEVKNVTEEAWKRYPDKDNKDQTTARNNLISEARKYKNSTQVRRNLYYALKNGSNDFNENVYNYNSDNGFKEFIITNEGN